MILLFPLQHRNLFLSALVILASSFAPAAELVEVGAKIDPRYPFRTDFANAHLPWYAPKPLEFPPYHSDHRISGELVSADFIHRNGQFRTSKTGELMDFTMPPYGAVNYLNAEADLRDVPLGTFFVFFLNQDAQGNFTRLATMQDQFTLDASHSFSYRLDELKLGESKLLTTKRSIPKKLDDLGKKELIVMNETRVWKGDKLVKLDELKPGDDLLYNLTGGTSNHPGYCTDIWIDANTHQFATEQQRKKFVEFTKRRGLPGWIEKIEGSQLTVTLFSGEWQSFNKSYLDDFAIGKGLSVVVANDELRTWEPIVDQERATLNEMQRMDVAAYGPSGVRLVLTVPNMLEGFRKGRTVRIFGSGWPMNGVLLKGPFFGESLMNSAYGPLHAADFFECTPKEYPDQFPFRTDHGNAHLPWYQVQEGIAPPRYSEHLVFGGLVKVDAVARRGQFRTERSGELVDFTLLQSGAMMFVNTSEPGAQGPAYFKEVNASVRYLDADATLADLPLGQRYRFHLYQDAQGAFTRASFVSDEFSHLAQSALTYRVTALHLDRGHFDVAWQHPEVKTYNGDMEQPPDFGRSLFQVTAETRVWKGDKQIQLNDLVVGDVLLLNQTGEHPGSLSCCTDIWVGVQTHHQATDEQRKKDKLVKRP